MLPTSSPAATSSSAGSADRPQRPFPATLTLHTWRDDAEPSHAFQVGTNYVERLWLPLLGPSAIALVRLLAELIDDGGDGQAIDVDSLAQALGVGATARRANSPLARAVRRLERFGVVKLEGAVLMVPAPPDQCA
jgi:hypothetical protein